jgi:hypothetical protein
MGQTFMAAIAPGYHRRRFIAAKHFRIIQVTFAAASGYCTSVLPKDVNAVFPLPPYASKVKFELPEYEKRSVIT